MGSCKGVITMRNVVIDKFEEYCNLLDEGCPVILLSALRLLKESPSQGVIDQIRWERDTAIQQLYEIGKGLGQKMDDIIAAKKDYAPRLLTLEEAYDAEIVWYESRCVYDSAWGKLSPGDTKVSTAITRLGHNGWAYEDDRDYGSAWRCWSKHPSDEQRKATKWKG